MDALGDIPKVEKAIQTGAGPAFLQKTDIFRKIMWFSFKDENTWHPVDTERVHEILDLNANGQKPDTLLDNEVVEEPAGNLNSDLVAMDKKFRKGNKKKRNKKRKHHNRGSNPKNKSKKDRNG